MPSVLSRSRPDPQHGPACLTSTYVEYCSFTYATKRHIYLEIRILIIIEIHPLHRPLPQPHTNRSHDPVRSQAGQYGQRSVRLLAEQRHRGHSEIWNSCPSRNIRRHPQQRLSEHWCGSERKVSPTPCFPVSYSFQPKALESETKLTIFGHQITYDRFVIYTNEDAAHSSPQSWPPSASLWSWHLRSCAIS